MQNMQGAGNLTARQIKAARALLDWSQDDLASASGLSVATIRKLEIGFISPRHATTHDIRRAFEDSGLEFIEPGGVRHRPEDIKIYHGLEGSHAFFDDIYETCKSKSCGIVQVWPSGEQFQNVLGDYKDIHYPRMIALRDTVIVRSITTDSHDVSLIAPYCECRWISKHYVYSVPFYVYDDKYAIILSQPAGSHKITVIQSRAVADAFRQQFYSMWEKATPLNTIVNLAPAAPKERMRG